MSSNDEQTDTRGLIDEVVNDEPVQEAVIEEEEHKAKPVGKAKSKAKAKPKIKITEEPIEPIKEEEPFKPGYEPVV